MSVDEYSLSDGEVYIETGHNACSIYMSHHLRFLGCFVASYHSYPDLDFLGIGCYLTKTPGIIPGTGYYRASMLTADLHMLLIKSLLYKVGFTEQIVYFRYHIKASRLCSGPGP